MSDLIFGKCGGECGPFRAIPGQAITSRNGLQCFGISTARSLLSLLPANFKSERSANRSIWVVPKLMQVLFGSLKPIIKQQSLPLQFGGEAVEQPGAASEGARKWAAI